MERVHQLSIFSRYKHGRFLFLLSNKFNKESIRFGAMSEEEIGKHLSEMEKGLCKECEIHVQSLRLLELRTRHSKTY